MSLFRKGSVLFPLFDGAEALQHGARWNSPGRRVVYCAESLACCRFKLRARDHRKRRLLERFTPSRFRIPSKSDRSAS